MNKEYRYEFGISLCNEDLEMAREIVRLSEISKDKIFLYESNQEDLIAKNAVVRFTSTFKNDCRVIVVIHSSQYGLTRYTSLEQDAITERILSERNKRFLLFVKIDDSDLPSWYDEHYIYLKKSVYTLEQIAKYIDHKVREQGGDFKELSIDEKLIKYDQHFQKEIEIDFFSKNAATIEDQEDQFKKEIGLISDLFDINHKKFEQFPSLRLNNSKDNEYDKSFYTVMHKRTNIDFGFDSITKNPDHTMYLNLNFWLSRDSVGLGEWGNQRLSDIESYYFSINEINEKIWRSHSNPRNYYYTEELVNSKFKKFIDIISNSSLNLL